MTDAKMKSFMEIGPTESQILKRQKIEKDKIEKLANRCTLKEQPVQFAQKENNTQLRIVLLGKVGVGKSSLGNLLTGQETFKAYNTAETGTVTISSSESEEFNVHVIDTPGLYDSENTDITTEIAKVIVLFFNTDNYIFLQDATFFILNFNCLFFTSVTSFSPLYFNMASYR